MFLVQGATWVFQLSLPYTFGTLGVGEKIHQSCTCLNPVLQATFHISRVKHSVLGF